MELKVEIKHDRISGARYKSLLTTNQIVLCDVKNNCTAKNRSQERLCGWYLSDFPLSNFCQYRHPPKNNTNETLCGVGKFFPKEMKRKHNEFLEVHDGKD